jgi:hypothetical protein
MTVLAPESRSVNGSQYCILLANFDAAYRNMKNASEDFNNALAEVSGGLAQHEGRSRIEGASRAHENAREEFMFAVAKLNEFLIGQIISSRSTLQAAANHG